MTRRQFGLEIKNYVIGFAIGLLTCKVLDVVESIITKIAIIKNNREETK